VGPREGFGLDDSLTMSKRFWSIAPARIRRILWLAGLVILLAGFTAAGIVWHTQEPGNPDEQVVDPAAALATSDSGVQSREVEIYYGKTGVLMERWAETAGRLTHGKPLAKTIMAVSSLAAVSCYLVAARWFA
jgi:hypothetical protein